jgi:hypothetical protein
MWTIFCETCERTVLLGMRRVRGVTNVRDGIVVALECDCGEVHSVRTGRGPSVAA